MKKRISFLHLPLFTIIIDVSYHYELPLSYSFEWNYMLYYCTYYTKICTLMYYISIPICLIKTSVLATKRKNLNLINKFQLMKILNLILTFKLYSLFIHYYFNIHDFNNSFWNFRIVGSFTQSQVTILVILFLIVTNDTY